MAVAILADVEPQPTDLTPSPGRLAYAMRALGADDPPPELVLGGTRYVRAKIVKHDFFAATSFYKDESGGLLVLKMGRTTSFYGIPLCWMGRFLCRREMRFYLALSDLPNVPAVIGTYGSTGFAHAFVPGHPLSRTTPAPDGFFDQLVALMRQLHARDIAYIDTNKPENILQGDDGRPYLIDFQISWDLHELGDWFLNRWWLRRMQREDLYHLLKHKRRFRPDELTPQEAIDARRRSGFIRLHRILTRPYFILRRAVFHRLRARGRLLPEGSK